MNNIKTGWLFWVAVFCSVASFAAAPDNYSWQKGNQFFAAKQYDSAAFYFENIAAKKPAALEVYYNLGNSYYRLNNIGKAVLNYSRALAIDPGFEKAKDNLELTQSRIKNSLPIPQDIFFVKWWKAATRAAYTNVWAISGLLFCFMFFAVLFRKNFRKSSAIPPQLPVILVLLVLVCIMMAIFSSQRATANFRAVVMEDNALFKPLTDTAQKQVFIPEGTIVNWEENTGDAFVKVSLPDGRSGRMLQADLEKIQAFR